MLVNLKKCIRALEVRIIKFSIGSSQLFRLFVFNVLIFMMNSKDIRKSRFCPRTCFPFQFTYYVTMCGTFSLVESELRVVRFIQT